MAAKKRAKKTESRPAKAGTTSRKRGRPSKFSWALAERVLDGIAGGESLTKVCNCRTLPTRKTVSGWVRKGAVGVDPDLNDFAKGFVLACEVRRALLEDDFVELISRIKKASNQSLLDGDAIRFKLEMDGLKWYLGKFRPGASMNGVDEALARLGEHGAGAEPVTDEAAAERLLALRNRVAADVQDAEAVDA